jgi:hypothetical protein
MSRSLLWVLVMGCTSGSDVSDDPSDSETVDTDLGGSEPVRDTAFPTPFERDLAPRLSACAGCHAGSAAAGGLDLTDVRTSLGVTSSHLDMMLIEPGDHLESYLWHKVAGTHSVAGGLGQQMPPGEVWSGEDVDLLARWIDLGAPE